MGERPTLDYEARCWAQGKRRVAGVDEAGRGALAGPVVAAAVIVPWGCTLEGVWAEVRDSKLLAPRRREALAEQIEADALAWAVGVVPCGVIDACGIAAASRQAMVAAVQVLDPAPDALLIDWVRLPTLPIAQQSMAKADARIVSVAAASILAKVHRDRLMATLDAEVPGYGFAAHKGYGTAAHHAAIAELGPCAHHRRSFAPFLQPALLEQTTATQRREGAEGSQRRATRKSSEASR
jgi:ribonuclease HII